MIANAIPQLTALLAQYNAVVSDLSACKDAAELANMTGYVDHMLVELEGARGELVATITLVMQEAAAFHCL